VISKRREHWDAEDLVEVLNAFWEPHDFSVDLGLQAWTVLSFVVLRTNTNPLSINELSKVLHMRWGKLKDILTALEDSGFIVLTHTKQRLVIQVREPKWLPEGDAGLTP